MIKLRSSLILFLLLLAVLNLSSCATQKPKLVLFISIDQLRYDYLTRFSKYFGDGGFNLFFKDGANFTNAQFKHSVTKTSAGHAVISTGTHANVNGIIANGWYDQEQKSSVSSVGDDSFTLIASDRDGRSPHYLLAATIGDELKRSNGEKSKVVSISYKSTSAIMMGGKDADAVYWFVDSLFTTSKYYLDELPNWVKDFNSSGRIKSYFGKTWDRILSDSVYSIQGPDDVEVEDGEWAGLGRTFPHTVDGGNSSITESYFMAFRFSPFGNELLEEFVEQAIFNEKLGQRDAVDILWVGFSSNDWVGHLYGPDSPEVMDMVIRTDRVLEKLFDFVDEKIGLNQCTIVLTSDHGIPSLPELIANKNNAASPGRINREMVIEVIDGALSEKFGLLGSAESWVSYVSPSNIYLNRIALHEKSLSVSEAEQIVLPVLSDMGCFHALYTHSQLENGEIAGELGERALLSFFPGRSGDVFFQLKENWLFHGPTGTNHGSPWKYNTHVPLLFYGSGIKPGVYEEAVSIADIAPTVAQIIKVDMPEEVQGKVLEGALK
ncbi:alkaline phosphatase family protein [candidate division KSB1 bacterium]|nr:alkaline phosphatase family protein [candidate division KSB1 bacterium]